MYIDLIKLRILKMVKSVGILKKDMTWFCPFEIKQPIMRKVSIGIVCFVLVEVDVCRSNNPALVSRPLPLWTNPLLPRVLSWNS